jgi:hypothetical protein
MVLQGGYVMETESVAVKSLRPTQIAVGMRLVKAKRKGLRARERKPQELVTFIIENPIRAVRGPGGDLWVVDHHHLGHALQQEGFKTAPVVIIGDVSKVSRRDFWKTMEEKGWLHPFDSKGRKRPIKDIPAKIIDMEDDPYRSLAGFVREAGGFAKSQTPYAEFLWADYYRKLIPLKRLKRNFDKALEDAMDLAHKTEAAGLPGYSPTAQKKEKKKGDDE